MSENLENENANDPYAQLDAQLDEKRVYPPTWKPEPGDKIMGKILRINEVTDSKGDKSHVAEIEQEDGKIMSVWLNVVLADQFSKEHINVGDVIGIKFLGVTGEKRKYKNYYVVKSKPAE